MAKPNQNLLGPITVLDRDQTGTVDATGARITNVGNPIDSTDLTTKDYVDGYIIPGYENRNSIFTASADGYDIEFADVEPSLTNAIGADGRRHLKRNDIIYAEDYPYLVRPKEYSGAGAATAGSPIIEMSSAPNLEVGEGVVVLNRGPYPNLLPPPAPNCTIIGSAGSASITYYLTVWNIRYGQSAVSSGTTVTNVPDSLDDENYIRIRASEVDSVFGFVEENIPDLNNFDCTYSPTGVAYPNGAFGTGTASMRLVLTQQINKVENGVYELAAEPVDGYTKLQRPSDFYTGDSIPAGTLIFGRGRTENRAWQMLTGGVVDTDEITFCDDDPWMISVWIDTARTGSAQHLDFICSRTTWTTNSYQYEYFYDDTGRDTFNTGPTSFMNNAPSTSPTGEAVYARVINVDGTTLTISENLSLSGTARVLADSSIGLKKAIEEATSAEDGSGIRRVIEIPGNYYSDSIYCWQNLIIENKAISFKGKTGNKPIIRFGPFNGLNVKQTAQNTYLSDLYILGWGRAFPPWFVGYDMVESATPGSYSVADRHRCELPRGGLLFLQSRHVFERITISTTGGIGITVSGASDHDGSNTNLSRGQGNIGACDDGGIVIIGYDASQSTYEISAVGSRKVGIADASFTGCYWLAPHTDSNYRCMLLQGSANRSKVEAPYFESGQGDAVGQNYSEWGTGNYGSGVTESKGYKRTGLYCTPFKIQSGIVGSSDGFNRWMGWHDSDNSYIAGVDHYEGDPITSSGIWFVYDTVNDRYAYRCDNTTDANLFEIALTNYIKRTMPSFPRGFLFGRQTANTQERMLELVYGIPSPHHYREWQPGDILKDYKTQRSYSLRERAGNSTLRENSTLYELGVKKQSSNKDGLLWTVISRGITDSSEPAGYSNAIIGDTVVDGAAELKCTGYCGPVIVERSTEYSVGDIVQPDSYINRYGLCFRCIVDGESSVTEPHNYQSAYVGDTVTDGYAEFLTIRYPERQNSTAYIIGQRIAPQNSPYAYICKTAGTTDSSEPVDYATAEQGDDVIDGYAVFTATNFSVAPDWIEVGKTQEHRWYAQYVAISGDRYLNNELPNQPSQVFYSYRILKKIEQACTAKSLRACYMSQSLSYDVTFTLMVCQDGFNTASNPTVIGDFNNTALTFTIASGDREGYEDFNLPLKAGAWVLVKINTSSADSVNCGIQATLITE